MANEASKKLGCFYCDLVFTDINDFYDHVAMFHTNYEVNPDG